MHYVISHRRFSTDAFETVLFRILCDQYRRQDVGNIVSRFLCDVGIDRPEVCGARSRNATVNVAGARVVGGHRQFPVSVVTGGEALQIFGGRSCRLLKTIPLINPRRLAQTKLSPSAGDKLPQARSGGPRHCLGLPGALYLAQPGDINRHAFFLEYLARHLHINTRPAQSRLHRASTTTLIIVDVLLDQRIWRKDKVYVLLRLLKREHVVGRNILLISIQNELAELIKRGRLKLLIDKSDLLYWRRGRCILTVLSDQFDHVTLFRG